MPVHQTCDGIRRRDFMRIGALGLGGLSMPMWLEQAAARAQQTRSPEQNSRSAGDRTLRSAIFVNLPGGPSHLDTFDLKPDAAAEYRGTFSPISTNVSGIQISEHLPRLAACMDKFAIVRGVTHTLAAHRLGSDYVNTGNKPLASLEYPGYGCVVAKEFARQDDLPPLVAIPNSNQRPGYLGVKYAPLNTNNAPTAGQPFSVRGISLADGLALEEVQRRTDLLNDLDSTFRGLEQRSDLLDGLDRFSQQAYEIITSPRARLAFDISQETPSFARQFAEESFAQSCLLAIRLIEAGVPFVTLTLGGWDTHADNFTRLKERQLPQLDNGLAPLLVGLEQKGLLESTAVMVTGEFGRTPKINSRTAEGGRDHYPRCMFMLMAGGNVPGGQVVGESDETAAGPRHEGYSPDDLAATFYANIGIDAKREYHTNTGRPVMIVRNGQPIQALLG